MNREVCVHFKNREGALEIYLLRAPRIQCALCCCDEVTVKMVAVLSEVFGHHLSRRPSKPKQEAAVVQGYCSAARGLLCEPLFYRLESPLWSALSCTESASSLLVVSRKIHSRFHFFRISLGLLDISG